MKEIKIDKEILIKIVLPAITVVIIIFLYFYFFWLPVDKKLSDLNNKIAKLDNDIKKAKAIKSKYPDLENKLNELREQKILMEKKLPKEDNMPEIMRTLKKLADKNSIRINSISPATLVKEQYFFRTTYHISGTGSYHKIGNFIAEIALEERILNVENLLISAGEPSTFSFVLVSYQYKGDK